MIRPFCYNIPDGKSEQEALSDELLEALEGVFHGVNHAFGDNATLYRLDIGRVYESVKNGDLVVAGQFADRSDGEVFDFEINQGTGKVGYKSTGDFLDRQSLAVFLGEETGDDDGDGSSSESSDSGPYPFDLLLQAINEEGSEAYQSPFASKLRKDLDCLGALLALMYHAGATIEAQPLYTGLHIYAIKYALRGLKLFFQSIGSIQGEEAGKAAEAWVDEHGLDFASAVVKEFSARRCARFQESIQAEDQDAIQEVRTLIEEAIGMAMSTTTDLIKSVVEAVDYRAGDVQGTLADAIEEYCPIDNSEGYSAVENARQLSAEWQEVVTRSGCTEDLSMQALGLPSAGTIPSEQGKAQAHQIEATPAEDPEDDQNSGGERIFYVNVGEGPSRNWDDCRQFGFLAAGGGRKWSKQLDKIRTGDTVIAYLKGYGYVGIGKITTTATPATKFTVNGVPIKELPLINDTIRSIKRFSKENGEYLVGVDWLAAVAREQAVWQANAGLYTTALVCASLGNQPATISFAKHQLLNYSNAHVINPSQGCEDSKHGSRPSYANVESRTIQSSLMESASQQTPLTCESAIMSLRAALIQAEEDDLDTDDVMRGFTNLEWQSDVEFLDFFEQISIEIAQSAARDPDQETAEIFGRPIYYGLSLGSPYFSLWEQAFKTSSPRLTEMINIEEWETDIASEIEELSLIMLIPLAAAYEQPIFESLRNRVVIDPSEAEEEFLGYVAAALAPGYFEGTLPPEILNIPSARVLCEILEDWSQYRDLWTPSIIEDFLSSRDSANYISKEVRGLIARVLKGEDPYNLDEWERHREDYWTDDEVDEILRLYVQGIN